MRKLKKFKNEEISKNQLSSIIGGKMDATRSLCTIETCVANCSDTTATWTRDNDDGTIISTHSETSTSNNDCP